ncbi:MAG: hypothetical protein AB7G44_15750 [Bacteroidia bacterium]
MNTQKLKLLFFTLLTLTYCFCQGQSKCDRKTRKFIINYFEKRQAGQVTNDLKMGEVAKTMKSDYLKCYVPVHYITLIDSIKKMSKLQIFKPQDDVLSKKFGLSKFRSQIMQNDTFLLTKKIEMAQAQLDSINKWEDNFYDNAALNNLVLIKKYAESITIQTKTFSDADNKTKKYLLRKYGIKNESYQELNTQIKNDTLLNENNKKAIALYKSEINHMLDSLKTKQESIAQLRKKNYYESDSRIDSLQDEVLKMLSDPENRNMRQEYVFERAGEFGESLKVTWKMPLDTTFAFDLGDYNTDVINKKIKTFVQFVRGKSELRKLPVDYNFLAIADAYKVTTNLKYMNLILGKRDPINHKFRIAINQNSIYHNELTNITIYPFQPLNNLQLAALRCYNAFAITKEYLLNLPNKIRFLNTDIISFEGDEAKKGAEYRRIEIVAFIYNFFLIDADGNEIPFEFIKENQIKGKKSIREAK